jgi:hypothetical protein
MWMLCPRVGCLSPDGFDDGFVEEELVEWG